MPVLVMTLTSIVGEPFLNEKVSHQWGNILFMHILQYKKENGRERDGENNGENCEFSRLGRRHYLGTATPYLTSWNGYLFNI